MADLLEISVLGGLTIKRGGLPVTALASRKAEALLVYLACTRRPHAREVLADLLWDDRSQSQALGNLRVLLTSLRQALGSHLIITRQTVAFNQDTSYRLDVAELEQGLAAVRRQQAQRGVLSHEVATQLAQALALYQGDFLLGFYLRDSQGFEEWLVTERERLRLKVIEALHDLVAAYLNLREYSAGIEQAGRLLQLDPLQEEVHRQLMRLLVYSGQRNAALTQYEACRRVLADEVGVEPTPETTVLYEAIKARKLVDSGSRVEDRVPPTFPHSPSTILLPPFLSAAPPQPDTAAPFVAREQELAELEAALATARSGAGQILFVIGGAGRGKTMLVQEFARQAQITDAELLVVSGDCNAHTGLGDPYLPFREVLTMLTGEVEAKWAGGLITADQARRLWEAMPLTIPALVEHAPDLVDTFVPGKGLRERAATFALPDAPWFKQLGALTSANVGAKLEQQRIFAQYTAALTVIANQRPLLLILEDLHWMDAASSGLLFHLSRATSRSRILTLGTYRPDEVALSRGEMQHPLVDILSELKRRHGDIWLDLGELAATEGRHFVEAYLDTQPNRLGPVFREALFQRTGGHALFTVELLREMQERGDVRQDEHGQWIEGPAIDWNSLPARVEGVIEKRIQRLEKELQTILTIASVEGETFTAEVVARVQQLNERGLIQQLSRELDKRHRLVSAQILSWLGQQRLSLYRFRHHLFQHYLYHNLTEMERVYLHEAVGSVLEAIYGEQTEQVSVQLARHFEQAGLTEKAMRYLLQAGNRARRLSANKEAIDHLSRGLELLTTLPTTPERTQYELEFQIALGNALTATKGHSAPEVERAFNQARELCQQVEGETRQLIQVLYGLWLFYRVRAEHLIALELGEQLLSLAQSAPDSAFLLVAHKALGATFFNLGKFAQARTHLEQGIALYDPLQHRSLIALYAEDIGAACFFEATSTLWYLGYPDQALRLMHKSLSLAQALAHPFTLAGTLWWAAFFHQCRRETQAVREQVEAVLTLSTEQGFSLYLEIGTMLRGWALAEQGQPEEGLAQLHQVLANLPAAGIEVFRSYFLGLLGEVYGKVGQTEEGLSVLTEALETVDKSGERIYEAELHRLKGELLLKSEARPFERVGLPSETPEAASDEAEAEKCFWQAIEVAQRQEAKSLELRATVSLGRLWQWQGKKDEARQMLAEIYGWFTEGFDTVDLREAKALLEELSA